MGSLRDAIDHVSTMQIVDYFDIPMRAHGGYTWILCPKHDDHHFGSCYIDKNDNGYYCYVCKEHVNKWDMVMLLLHASESDVAKWFFTISGIKPDKFQTDPEKDIKKTIQLIERLCYNNPVFTDLKTCEKKETSYGRMIGTEYLYSEKIEPSPLFSLYKAAPNVFQTTVESLIRKKIEVLVEQYKTLEKKEESVVGVIDPFQHNLLLTYQKNIKALQALMKKVKIGPNRFR